MDKVFESTKRRPTFEAAFKDTFEQFLELRSTKFDFKHLEIRLPVGLMKQTMLDADLPFGKNVKQQRVLEYVPKLMAYRNVDIGGHKYFPMTLAHVRGMDNSKGLRLAQTFSTCADRYNKKPLFNPNQYLERKNGYYYRWNKAGSRVTISKLIGTTKINQIKLQSEKLIEECLRFIFLYCQS